MKITTRIIAGYGFLIVLLAALVTYHAFNIHRMQAINGSLSRIDFRRAQLGLQLLRDRDLVEEYSRKSLALGDPDYAMQLKGFQDDFESTLMELRSNQPTPEESAETERLVRIWDAFKTDLGLHQAASAKGGIADFPKDLEDWLEQLRAQAFTVYQASLHAIASAVETSGRMGEVAVIVSWCAAAIALVLSILVSLLIYRSISVPLVQLTEGTRAIADGKFFYRLDTSREDEFAHLAKDFNSMTERLNELDDLKKGFVSHVSHELKAPLASMRETIQLMLEGIPGPLNDKQRRLLELNLQSGWRLTSMIGNLLDLSRMEAGVMEYELRSQDLVPLVRTAIAELEVQAREKHIDIRSSIPDGPLLVDCDGDRIVQIVVNLLGNAMKFSPASSAIQVCVQPAASPLPHRTPKEWCEMIAAAPAQKMPGLVSIADSGPGVPDSQKEKIFERFHQVRQGRRIAGQGVGLGLAISRTIVEAHRGALWVEDNPSGGSIFYLLLRPGSESKQTIRCASNPL